MNTEDFEEWFIPLHERYVKEHTSAEQKALWLAQGLPEQNFIDHAAGLSEGYYDCYDFVEWALRQKAISKK